MVQEGVNLMGLQSMPKEDLSAVRLVDLSS